MALGLKWFVRVGLGAAALGSLAFIPFAIFLGVMATDAVGTGGCAEGSDCARNATHIAYFIMATPLILSAVLIIALVWVERHPKYRAAMAGLVFVAMFGFAAMVPPQVFLVLPDFWRTLWRVG